MKRNAQVEDILARLRKARVDAGLTQEQAAQCLACDSASTISHYETGKREITIETLLRLADIYGVLPEWLIASRRSYQCEMCGTQMYREDSMLHAVAILRCSSCGYAEYD